MKFAKRSVTRNLRRKECSSVAYALRVLIAKSLQKKEEVPKYFFVAGETRFEHATNGFGDRCSTVEPLPFVRFNA